MNSRYIYGIRYIYARHMAHVTRNILLMSIQNGRSGGPNQDPHSSPALTESLAITCLADRTGKKHLEFALLTWSFLAVLWQHDIHDLTHALCPDIED